METENKVSLWLGNFNSLNDLNNFTKQIYNGDGEASSKFMEIFRIEFIDNQFEEVDFYENMNTKEDVLDGFSYIDSFINEIPDLDWSKKKQHYLLI